MCALEYQCRVLSKKLFIPRHVTRDLTERLTLDLSLERDLTRDGSGGPRETSCKLARQLLQDAGKGRS